MNLVKSVQPLLTIFGLDTGRETAVAVSPPALPSWQPAETQIAPRQPEIIVIPGQVAEQNNRLSELINIGRLHHPLCRNAFVEMVQVGYWAYEQREEWRTCTLAAAYAGAFGPQSVERPDFSYSMAVWRLSQRVGFDIGQRVVVGPTGRRNNLADEMIALTDKNLWTRAGVAEWVASLGY